MTLKSDSQAIIADVMAFDPTAPISVVGNQLAVMFNGVLPRLLVENLRNHGAKVGQYSKLDGVETLVTWEGNDGN